MMSETSCTWNKLALLCFFLRLIQLQLALTWAKISDCSSNNSLFFNEGSNLSLCCRLEPSLCNKTTLSDNLSFGYKGPSDYTVTRLNECMVRLDVRNVSKGDEGHQYSCSLKNITRANPYVAINKKLPTINITKFVCTYDKTIIVTFDRGVPQEDSILYTVSMIMWREGDTPGKNIVMCNETCNRSSNGTMCQAGEREGVCQYSDRFRLGGSLPEDENATITVTQHRPPGQTEYTSGTFSILDNIIPGPVSFANDAEVTANETVIKMCTDRKTKRCIYYGYGKYRPILYHILVNKTKGIPEHLIATIPTVKTCWCLRIRLTNLTAFTSYSVVAFLSAGGGNGAENSKKFTTSMSVPTHPPQLDVYSFLRFSRVDKTGKDTPAINIMWRPLPEEAHGGSNLSYIVQVTSFSGFMANQIVTDTFALFSNELLTTTLTVRIWAQNDVGPTESYSELQVPHLTDTRTTKTHVEFDGDTASVYVHLDDPHNVEELRVHWCQNYTDTKVPGVRICQEHPVTGFKTVSVKETMQFEINLSTTSHWQEITESTILEYRHENDTPSDIVDEEYEIATAKLTTQRLFVQSFSNYDTARRKRFLRSTVPGDTINVFGRRDRDAKTVSNGMDNTGHQYPLFISLVTRDEVRGHTQHGLIPVDCYFDKRKNKVKVEVNKEFVNDQSGLTLFWNQTCQGRQPEFFRADYFCVSVGINCENDNCSAPQYYNNIDQQNISNVAMSSEYICFHAYTNENNHGYTKYPVQVLQYSLNDISSTEVPADVISVVVAASVLTIMLGFLSYFCCRRWKHFRLILKTNLISLPGSFKYHVVEDAAKSLTKKTETQQPSCSDSGRGSGLEEIDTGLGEVVQLKLLDQAMMCATGSLHSGTSTSKVNSVGNQLAFIAEEYNGDHEKEGVAAQDNASEKAELCFNSSHASGESQYSGEDDGGSYSGCDEDEELSEVEEDAAQQQAFELAKMCFHYHTSGDTQSSYGGDTGEGADYSRSVIYSKGSNSNEDVKDVLVEEEDKLLG